MDEKEREKTRKYANLIAEAQYQYKQWEVKKVERELDTLFLEALCRPLKKEKQTKRLWLRQWKLW